MNTLGSGKAGPASTLHTVRRGRIEWRWGVLKGMWIRGIDQPQEYEARLIELASEPAYNPPTVAVN
jgi:hypothetical protein